MGRQVSSAGTGSVRKAPMGQTFSLTIKCYTICPLHRCGFRCAVVASGSRLVESVRRLRRVIFYSADVIDATNSRHWLVK